MWISSGTLSLQLVLLLFLQAFQAVQWEQNSPFSICNLESLMCQINRSPKPALLGELQQETYSLATGGKVPFVIEKKWCYAFFLCMYIAASSWRNWLWDLNPPGDTDGSLIYLLVKQKGILPVDRKVGFVFFCFPFTEDEISHMRSAAIPAAFLACVAINELAYTQLSKPRLNIVNDHSIFFLELKLWCDLQPFSPYLEAAGFILRAQQKHNTELSSKSNPLYFKTDD